MRPSARCVATVLGVIAPLVAAQPLGAAPPGPDPHPAANQSTNAPTPDPAPASEQTARTPGSGLVEPEASFGADVRVVSRPSQHTTSVERPATVKPNSQRDQNAKAQQPANKLAKPKPTPAKVLAPAPRGRGGEQPVRVAATSAAGIGVTEAATDPIVLGGLALLTLALSSAGLLLVLQRSRLQGIRT
jgi:hypothetical protein